MAKVKVEIFRTICDLCKKEREVMSLGVCFFCNKDLCDLCAYFITVHKIEGLDESSFTSTFSSCLPCLPKGVRDAVKTKR